MSSGRRRVLIVDDDESTVEVLKRFLLTKGFETVEAKDGQSAIDLAKRIRPDLILLDIMMPDLSGDVVCKALKDDPETAAVPVIMTTAKREREDLINGLDVGADDYVRKPFDVYELLARIKAHLRVRDLYRKLEASHVAALVDFLHTLPRGAGVPAVLEATLGRLGRTFDVAHGAVVLLEGADRERGVVVAASADGRLVPGEIELAALPEVLRAAESGEVVVEDAAEGRAAVAIPAVLGDRPVAVFRIRTSTERGLGPA
ncbi:MAG TPA: response regulator, partial [Thermodesulfobacteriota bacterium]